MELICVVPIVILLLVGLDIVLWSNWRAKKEEYPSFNQQETREQEYERAQQFVRAHNAANNTSRSKADGDQIQRDVVPGRSEAHWLQPYKDYYDPRD